MSEPTISEATQLPVLEHATRRMLQALDGYWLHCDGLPPRKYDKVRGKYREEDWWWRFDRYRIEVENLLRPRAGA